MPIERVTNRDLLIRYFLGTATEVERTRVEESLADDEAFFDLTMTEDQLVYDYLYGRLPKPDKDLFEKNYLGHSREREERFLLAKTLVQYGDVGVQQPASTSTRIDEGLKSLPARHKRGFWIPAELAATMSLIVVIGAVTLISIVWRQKNDIARLEQQRLTEQQNYQSQLGEKERQLQEVNRELIALKSGNENQFDLTPEITKQPRNDGRRPPQGAFEENTAQVHDYVPEPSGDRGGFPSKVISVPRQSALPLVLVVGSVKFPKYRVEIEKEGAPSSRTLFPDNRAYATPHGRAIRLTISTSTLDRGSYLVSVFGIKEGSTELIPVESYRFRVD